MKSIANKKSNKDKNHFNYWVEIVIGIFVLIAIALDIILKDKVSSIDYINSDIVMILLPLVFTTLAITLSLPRERIYGIENTEFRKLRGNKTYNFYEMLLITIIVFVIYSIGSNLNFVVSLWTLSSISVFYSIVFINQEIPILIHDDKKIKSIIRKNIHENKKEILLSEQSNAISMIDAIQDLLLTEGIISAYKVLETQDSQQNRIYLDKLLDIQNTYLFGYIGNHTMIIDSVKSQYKNIDIIQAVDTSLKNLKDIIGLNKALNILDIYGDEEHFYHVTRSMFALHKILSILEINHKLKREFSELIQQIFMMMNYGKIDKKTKRFYYKILNAMLVNTTPNDELWFLELLRDSSFEGVVSVYGTDEYMVFVSIYLYYLVELEVKVPQTFKDEIVGFINDHSRGINSDGENWKTVFIHKLNYIEPDKVSSLLSKLLEIYECNGNVFSWYESKKSSGRISSILHEKSFSKELLMDWWIGYVLSNVSIHAYTFNQKEEVQLPILTKNDETLFAVVLNKKWFDEDDKLITKNNLPIFSFYNTKENVENHMDQSSIAVALKDFKNKIIKESIVRDINENMITIQKLKEHKETLTKGFISAINNISILDRKIDLSEVNKRYFALRFDSRWSDGLITSVANKFPESIGRIIYDDFTNNQNINDKKNKITQYSTEDLHKIIDFNPSVKHAYIYESRVDSEKERLINQINKIPNGEKLWVPHDLFLRNNPIRINIEYIDEDSFVRFFNHDEINCIIDRDYKLVNGLYKYVEGADGEKSILLERDELFKIVANKFFYASIVFKCKIEYDFEDILYFDLSKKGSLK